MIAPEEYQFLRNSGLMSNHSYLQFPQTLLLAACMLSLEICEALEDVFE